ncbi:MAG: addiction module protein [Thiohalocapsa sp.]|nr:addiction module protein [Thiohalocapsa sp.]MCF7991821.1 addiction module protein [Thiohalocapsa sp.]
MEALWESLSRDGDELPSPDRHRAVLEGRLR